MKAADEAGVFPLVVDLFVEPTQPTEGVQNLPENTVKHNNVDDDEADQIKNPPGQKLSPVFFGVGFSHHHVSDASRGSGALTLVGLTALTREKIVTKQWKRLTH